MLKTWLRKFAEGPFFPLIVAGIYCLILGSAIYVTDYYPKGKIQDSLMTLIPWVLRINFLLLLLVLLVVAGLVLIVWRRSHSTLRRRRHVPRRTPVMEHRAHAASR